MILVNYSHPLRIVAMGRVSVPARFVPVEIV